MNTKSTPLYPASCKMKMIINMSLKYMDLVSLVPAPGAQPDYTQCLALMPQLAELAQTPQDPYYHAEGDVWTHTKMVVDALIADDDYRRANDQDRFTLFYSALLHDISKPATTVIDESTGRVSQPGHSRRGSIDARLLLWRAGVPFEQREHICRIISVHQLPFFAISGDNKGKTPEFLIHKLSCELPLWMLCAVAKADMVGRVCPDQDNVLVDIELFRAMADELGCLDKPAIFADDFTRMSYLNGANVAPQYPLYRESKGSQVIVMCGIPASGKDTWVKKNAPGLPVVSFDDSRDALGLSHGKNEGMVAHHAIDQAKSYLRKAEPFVWNATHLSRQMRDKTLDLLHRYNADVHLVYLEQPEAVLLSRNKGRDTSLSNKDLTRMLFKWEVPLPTEVAKVTYLAEIEKPKLAREKNQHTPTPVSP